MYCEKCCRIIDSDRCPVCKSRRVREPEAKDPCFLTELGYINSSVLEDLLRQNQIPFMKKDAIGAGITSRIGVVLEKNIFYVPYEELEAAKAIVEELFTEVQEDAEEQPE
ncbi:MAG: hypothetical protein IKH38_01195 [Clostridia bacterium]|nr:hypothetical protein [Clostridia bacterium]